jgi:hypothetical protein
VRFFPNSNVGYRLAEHPPSKLTKTGFKPILSGVEARKPTANGNYHLDGVVVRPLAFARRR